MRPEDLAAELAVRGVTLRNWLRATYPRAQKRVAWDLTSDQVAVARAAFADRRVRQAARVQAMSSGTMEWYWEGNVQTTLAHWLEGQGWTIESMAVTATKQRGTDIVATCDGRTMRVEVKGWPTAGYADPARAGEIKKTRPGNQAPKWFSQAVTKVMIDLGAHPTDLVAIGLPDWPKFRTLISATEASLRKLGVGLFLVAEDGSVEERLPLGEIGDR